MGLLKAEEGCERTGLDEVVVRCWTDATAAKESPTLDWTEVKGNLRKNEGNRVAVVFLKVAVPAEGRRRRSGGRRVCAVETARGNLDAGRECQDEQGSHLLTASQTSEGS